MSGAREETRVADAFFRINRKTSALLIIDMQNAFLEPGAILEAPMGRDIITRLARLIDVCRELCVPVIWVRLDSSAPYGGLLLEKYPSLREQQVLYKGTHSFELFSDMPAPLENEFHIVKHKYDAFHRTDLDTLLRNIGADTVIITGVTTNCCCESTARSAFEHDYKVAFTSDATAAFEERLHEATLGTVRELFGRVVTVAEVINELGDSPA
ncbi:MAG: cysteine hydrolase [Gammaproteobacteria bacterium]|nr:cysteine hydrolase [Gammaproteobacteria bacterium]